MMCKLDGTAGGRVHFTSVPASMYFDLANSSKSYPIFSTGFFFQGSRAASTAVTNFRKVGLTELTYDKCENNFNWMNQACSIVCGRGAAAAVRFVHSNTSSCPSVHLVHYSCSNILHI